MILTCSRLAYRGLVSPAGFVLYINGEGFCLSRSNAKTYNILTEVMFLSNGRQIIWQCRYAGYENSVI